VKNPLFLNTGIFGNFPVELKLEASKAADFDLVEVRREDCEAIAGGAREISRICAGLDLGIASVMVLRDAVGIPRDMVQAKRAEALAMFEIALELGTDCVQVPSNALANADRRWADDDFRWLAEEAGRRSLRVAYEALSWAKLDRPLVEAHSRVARLGAANVGIELDLFHHFVHGSSQEDLDAVSIDNIFQIQLSDLPADIDIAGDDALIFAARHRRVLPGDGHFALRGAVSRLRDRGFVGPIGIEVFSDEIREMNPSQVAIDAMRSLACLLA